MAPSKTENDLYKVLGVTHGESREGIKRAYHQIQKKLIKQNEPEALQRIKQAYDILSDESTRKQYDAIWNTGGEVRILMEKAIGAIEEGNHIGASRHLGEVLSYKPNADQARDLLGICLVELGLMDEAIRTYDTLLERQPNVSLYWLHSGDVYLDQASKAVGEDNKPMLGSARNSYRRAFMLNPQRKAPYIALAKTYYKEKKYNQALSWVEKAITKIDKPDYEDFDTLFYMLRIHAMAGDEKRLIVAASKIEKFNLQDDDLKRYVASQYVKTANDIIKIKFYKAAKHFLTNATRHNPNNPELDKLHKKVDSIIGAESSWKNLEAEVSIIKPIKTLAALIFVHSCGNKTEEEYGKAVKSIRSKIAEYPPDKITTGIEILQNRYRPYYDFDPQLWNNIVNSLSPNFKSKAAYTTGYTGSNRKPATSAKGPISNVPSVGAAKSKTTTEIVVKATNWSPLVSAILGIILAVIGFFIIPVHWIGMFAGAILGYYIGNAVGKLM
ncbi:MAG: tetratricopeptide repeat protein [bacterium]|nr:tetratricopeptide repeat protein [bacterium]